MAKRNDTQALHPARWHQQVQGRIRVAGLSLSQVASLAGQTPFYVYDREAMRQRVQHLRAHLPAAIELHYAIKANPMPQVVSHMASLVDGLDVASLQELHLALATGTAPGDISFAGPGKKDDEIEATLAAGSVLIAESPAQIEALARAGERLGLTPRLALRVNPACELKSSGMRMTGGAKPFGIDAEALPEAIELARERGLEPCGLHLFTGSQNLNPTALCEAHEAVVELALQFVQKHNLQLDFVNIGGGFGIPYFPGDKPLELDAIADNLEQLLDRVARQSPRTRLVMEMGRYLVGEAGLYVCRVLERKDSRGTLYLITDGGLHHHLANSGNFGQVIRKNYPVSLDKDEHADQLETVTAVGPLCTPLDLVGERLSLPRADVGDLLVVHQSGAYGLSASPTGFLSHPRPVELLL